MEKSDARGLFGLWIRRGLEGEKWSKSKGERDVVDFGDDRACLGDLVIFSKLEFDYVSIAAAVVPAETNQDIGASVQEARSFAKFPVQGGRARSVEDH